MYNKLISLVLTLVLACAFTLGYAQEASPESSDLQGIYNALQADPSLTSLDIRDKTLTVAETATLLAAYPQVKFQYNVTMYGKTFPSDATVIDFGDLAIKEFDELAAGLALLPALTQADMYSAKISKEQMAVLHEQFPAMHFGWTVKLGTYKVRTDITAFSSLHSPSATHYTSGHYTSLQYCWQ